MASERFDRFERNARENSRIDSNSIEFEGNTPKKKTRGVGGIRKICRRGKRVLVLDFRYRIPQGPLQGKSARYRRDAEIQTWEGAKAELKRRLAALMTTGSPYEIVNKEARASVIREPPAFTFGQAIDEWKADYVPTLKATTQYSYELYSRVHLGHLREVPLHQIGAEHVRFIQKRDREAGRSAATTNQTVICLRSILRYAVEKKRLERTPVLPEKLAPPPREIETYSDEDVHALIEACKSPLERRIVLFSCYCGMRSSEFRGLRWRDIDFNLHTITVRQAITRGPGKNGKKSALYTERPKNKKERVIPMHEEVYRELLNTQERDPNSLVCANRKGKPFCHSNVWEIWDRIRVRAGVRRLSNIVHNGRHYFGTSLCRARVNVRAVQKLLGHSNITTTMRYVHATSKDLENAISDLEMLTMGARKGREHG